MIDSVLIRNGITTTRYVQNKSSGLGVFANSAESEEKSADNEYITEEDIVTLSEENVKMMNIMKELADFQNALKAYRDSGDIEPLKDYFDKTQNEALVQIFGKSTTKTTDDSKESSSVFENLEETSNYDTSAEKLETIAKRIESLYKMVNAVFRFTDYDGIENYVTEATSLVDEATKMFKKFQKAIDKMPDGPKKTAAEQQLASMKGTLKQIVAMAEKILEKAEILTAGMKEKPDSLKAFAKSINAAKPLIADDIKTENS